MADVLAVAASHLGEHGNKFWAYCGNTNEAWCAAYISTVLAEAGEGAAIGNKKMTSVAAYRDYFMQNNAYHTKGSGYTPQPGDVVVMKTGVGLMGSHVALVTNVYPDGSFDTIEGNRGGKGATGNTVVTDHYSGNESFISGYGVPRYTNPPVGGGNYSAIGSAGVSGSFGSDGSYTGGQSTGTGQYDFLDHTVGEDDTLISIAQQYNISPDLIISYNKEITRWDKLEPGTKLVIPQMETALSNAWEAGTANIERGHTVSVKAYHPVIRAEFYTEAGALAVTSEAMSGGVHGDVQMDFDIISVSTQRAMSADCASMSIMLTNRRDWYNILSSNDLVIVKMQRREFGSDADMDEDEQEVFIGVIDDIRKSLDFSSGQPKRAIQVTARNMGKAFVNFNVGLIKNITTDMGTGFLSREAAADLQMADINSAEAIRIVWDAFVDKALRYEFYNGYSLGKYIRYSSKPHAYENLPDWISYSQYSGSLWNFIKELSNAPFNETFWEVESGMEVLTHRPCPFDPEPWKGLRRTIIRDDDIVTDATGRSDLETYTVYIVNLRLMGQALSSFFNPLWYRPYYEKYGITQLDVTSTYGVSGGDDADAVRLYETEIFNWNIKNNIMANGQIVVKGRASYKIGQIVVVEYSGLEFYVEGVAHNFNVYGGWTTTLSVTRGLLPEERFTAPWGMGQEMTSDAMQKIISLTDGAEVDWTQVEMTGPFTVGGSAGISGSFAGSGGSTGTVNVPGSLKQCGIIPDDITAYDRTWASGSNQARVYQMWQNQEKPSSGGIATLNGRYLIAMRDGTIGQAGDIVDVHLDNGTVIHGILGDEKGDDCGNGWGHQQTYNAKGGIHTEGLSLVEFEKVGKGSIVDELKKNGWYLANVVSVDKLGTILGRG